MDKLIYALVCVCVHVLYDGVDIFRASWCGWSSTDCCCALPHCAVGVVVLALMLACCKLLGNCLPRFTLFSAHVHLGVDIHWRLCCW